jgi:hypothetical protein
MERKPSPIEKTEKEKEKEYIDIFSSFESANARNRDAFCELLSYTMENKKDS